MKLKVLVSNTDRNLFCFYVFIVLSNVFLHLCTVDIEGTFLIEFFKRMFLECVFVNFRDFIAFVLDADAPWYINIVVIYNRSF